MRHSRSIFMGLGVVMLTALAVSVLSNAVFAAGATPAQTQYPSYTCSISVPQNGNDTNLASLAKITPDQAKQSAVAKLSAAPSDVQSVKLDNENGCLIYSVHILKGGVAYDVKVDAGNAQALFVDQGADVEGSEGIESD